MDIDKLIADASAWIESQRARHRPLGARLDRRQRETLSAHFESDTLDTVRLLRVPVVENPSFYRELDRMPMDLRDSSGITFGDTVLLSERFVSAEPPTTLLFHEIVHVVQYALLGIPEFARRYVEGWADNGFEYRQIPLEAQAFELEDRLAKGALGDEKVEMLVRAELTRGPGHSFG